MHKRGQYQLPSTYSNIQMSKPSETAEVKKVNFENNSFVGSEGELAHTSNDESVRNEIATKFEMSDQAKEEEKFEPEEELLTNEDFEDLEEGDINCLAKGTARLQDGLKSCMDRHGTVIKYVMIGVFICLYVAYFIWSCYCSFKTEDDIRLVWMTGCVVFCVIVYYIKRFSGQKIYDRCWSPMVHFVMIKKHFLIFKWLAISIVAVLIIFYIIYFVGLKDPYNLVSLVGIVVYLIIGYLFSHNPQKVVWRPIIWGLLLQFVFALIILRTQPGLLVFRFLGDRVTEFLAHTDAGSKFVFGDAFLKHFFAFKILPVIIFFSCAISVLYYLGVMQMVISKVAWVMQTCMGTTAGESLNAAGNIFIGMTESPLMIRPLLGKMTNSELHAVLTSGFATIAGTVLAAYISFGVPADHLLSASVMSAPAALAMSKLFYPETKKSKTTAKHVAKMAPSPHKNIIEAVSVGASDSVVIVANIAANLIAFLAVLSFINATLTWFGDRACLEEPLTFQFICSYLLWPLAVVMGVEIKDCRLIGELIGVKTFLNEFIAYDQLGKLIKNRLTYESFNASLVNMTYVGRNIFLVQDGKNATLIKGFLEPRSEVIATYTLCGFANFGSIGMMLSSLGAMAPHRRRDLSTVVLRALVAGNVACFLTACIAGLFYDQTANQ